MRNKKILARSQAGLCTDRAHGSLRPLAASLFSVNSSGVPSVFHCRQSGIGILPWPWSPPMLQTDQYDEVSHGQIISWQTDGLCTVVSNRTVWSWFKTEIQFYACSLLLDWHHILIPDCLKRLIFWLCCCTIANKIFCDFWSGIKKTITGNTGLQNLEE